MIKERHMRDQCLHRSLSYNISGLTVTINQTELLTKQMTTTTDHVAEAHHETTTILKTTPHNTDTVLHHKIGITMTEVILLKITLVHVMIIMNETLGCFVLLIEHTDHLTDAISILDAGPVLIQGLTILHDSFLHSDLLQDQEILGILDPALALTQERKSIQSKLNHRTIPSDLKYIRITLQKWLTL